MKRVNNRNLAVFLTTGALALSLSACGQDATDTNNGNTASPSSAKWEGNLAGAGASSQGAAMEAWTGEFISSVVPGATVSYDPVGSGGGRKQFLSAGVQFAGSDSALKEEELAEAENRCFGGEALELPLYISPIAVVYNLPDVSAEHLNLDAKTIANIFNGTIKKWNDPVIAEQNEGVDLPDLAIIPVNRSDESGTTENFTEYLAATSEGAWSFEPSGDWPITGTQSGDKTSGLIDTVKNAKGAIGYADASRAGDLGTVALKVGDEYVPFSPEAAAKVVDASPRATDATDKRLVVELDRNTTEAGAYPLVLISYLIACDRYDSQSDVDNVKNFFTFVASKEGQELASQPEIAGSAPISANLRTEVQAAIDSISVAK